MKTRKLGNNNLEVSAIGFGCMGLNFSYVPSLSKDEGIALIRAAVRAWRYLLRHRRGLLPLHQ
jgi:aryl-alcohol dehydrogenase-like predicted oxidoreductase